MSLVSLRLSALAAHALAAPPSRCSIRPLVYSPVAPFAINAKKRRYFEISPLALSVVTGVIWLIDVLIFSRLRQKAARAAGKNLADIPEPGTVDYARSFFPVALAVLVLRAFVFEPFRIPSDSMMPTTSAPPRDASQTDEPV